MSETGQSFAQFFITQRRSVGPSEERWMFSAASVIVCVFVNTITSERINIG